jgi:hypothetical protein
VEAVTPTRWLTSDSDSTIRSVPNLSEFAYRVDPYKVPLSTVCNRPFPMSAQGFSPLNVAEYLGRVIPPRYTEQTP